MNKIFDNKQEFTELYRDAVMSISGKSVEAASDLDRFNALAKLVAEKARTVATKSDARATAEGKKRVYYFSIEFLIGRLLDNYLLNFGVRDMVAEALDDMGFDLSVIESQEPDPALGNGGLGRLHVDGIRMDGVSSMLYLNFGIDDPGQKKFNKYGTEEDLDASAFIRQVNCAVEAHYPDVMMMAEESTAWPLVTYPPQDGGLGFHYKWDMGWMNDTLHYMQTDFPWRPGNHGLLTFSIMYAFTENFICPLSHDEVVHGKCSLIGRMPGDWWRQFAGLRTLAFYQMTHPGAKLNFMGNEIGQFIEWRYYESIQWFLTEEYETHKHHQAFIKALNHLYTAEPALYERGYTDDGFTWIDADNSKQSIVSFVRQGEDVDDDLVILINFDPASYESFRVGVPREGDWEVIFDSDRPEFGGSGYAGDEPYTCSSEPYPWNGQMDSIEIKVPGLAGVVLKRRGPSSYKPPVVEEPKKATRKRSSSAKPKPAAAKKAPAKTKATTTKAKAAAKPAAKAAAKKPAAKKGATKAKSASVKPSAKDA